MEAALVIVSRLQHHLALTTTHAQEFLGLLWLCMTGPDGQHLGRQCLARALSRRRQDVGKEPMRLFFKPHWLSSPERDIWLHCCACWCVCYTSVMHFGKHLRACNW